MNKNLIKIFKHNEIYIFIIIGVLALVVNSFNRNFLTFENMFDLLKSNAMEAVVALGVFVVLISGGIDVSFMAIATVSMYVAVMILKIIGGNILLAFLIAGFLGIILGGINSSLISYFKIPTLIATLATMSIFHGLLIGLLIILGKSTHIPEVPEYFSTFKDGMVFTLQNKGGNEIGLPYLVLPVIIIYVITWLILKYSTLGRNIYAIGGDIESARRAGLNIQGTQFFVYCYSGFLGGIASVLHVSLLRYVNAFSLVGKELDVIAMVVIGGAALSGGKGSVLGTFLGVLLLTIIKNSLILMGIPTLWDSVAVGFIIIISIIVTKYRTKGKELLV